jgi:hypothetical protein
MRKAIPFVLTVVVSMLCTATLVRAAGSSGETALQPSSVAPSEVLGSGLDLNQCIAAPNNASEWSKFAKCMTTNMTKVKQWARVLDTCFTTFQVIERSNVISGDPTDPLNQQTGPALAPANGDPSFKYYVGWKRQANCPQT